MGTITFSFIRVRRMYVCMYVHCVDNQRQACAAALSTAKQRGERVSAQLRASNDSLHRTKQVREPAGGGAVVRTHSWRRLFRGAEGS